MNRELPHQNELDRVLDLPNNLQDAPSTMDITLGTETLDFVPWKPVMGQVFEDMYAFDTETTLIDDNNPWITPCYILGAVSDGTHGYFISREHVADFVKAHRTVPVAFHNAPFDLEVLQLVVGKQLDLYAMVEDNLVWDTQLLHRLLVLGTDGHTARGKDQSTLETCCKLYLDLELPKDECDSQGDVVRLSYSKWLQKPLKTIAPLYLDYLGKDVLATLRVYQELQQHLSDLLDLRRDGFGFVSDEWLDEQIHLWGPQTHHTQLKGAIVLRVITANGIHINRGQVDVLQERLEAYRQELLEQLRGYGWLPGKGSDKSLQSILSKIEQRSEGIVLKRTPTGKIATSEEALEELKGQEPFVATLLEYKATNKLLTTYLEKMKKGVVHPSFNPLTEGGRTSAFGDINSQNLPTNDGIRACFVPSPGNVFITADYAQVELATLAQTVQLLLPHTSNEMAKLINAGEDLHSVLASKVLGKPAAEVSRDERKKVKAISFGKPGGMGTVGLVNYAKASYGVQMSVEEAEDIEEVWFELFPEMRDYLNVRLDAWHELAVMLELSPALHAEYTGDSRFCGRGDDCRPSAILGGMCLKVVREDYPTTARGKAYPLSDITFFWDLLEENIDAFPEELHSEIRRRKPSVGLFCDIRNYLTSGPVFTTTGRLRANAGYCQQRNTPFQGLAADGAKLALWKLWRAGYRIVNFIHDEVIIEVPETANLGFECERIRSLMQQGMFEVVPDVAVNVEYAASKCWSKDATVVLDDRGRIVPWSAA